MAELLFKGDHNKHAFSGRGKGDDHYVEMMEFLQRSKIHYALTRYPAIIHESLVTQFWRTTHTRSVENGPIEIMATVDGEECVVPESLVRTQLQLDDEGGEYELAKEEILAGLQAAGYRGNGKVW
jgi:hypothetical protein